MKSPQFACVLDYSIICSRCRKTVPLGRAIWGPLDPFQFPSLPDGWHVIDRALICSDHKIFIDPKVNIADSVSEGPAINISFFEVGK